MKYKKFILFYVKLILMFSLISISGNNSIIGTKNLKSNTDDKRTLQQSNNYIIIQFNETVEYNGDFFSNFKNLIEYIKNGDSNITDISQNFTVEVNTVLEVYFKEDIKSLESLFNTSSTPNFDKIITADLSHFDTSSVTNMKYMFYGCSSLQNLNLSNFDTSSVTNMKYMF